MNSAVPIKFAVCNTENVQEKSGGQNKQNTINMCKSGSGPKARDLRRSQNLQFDGVPIAVPSQFFCLPFFQLQCGHVAVSRPGRNEDAAKFHFVDLKKF